MNLTILVSPNEKRASWWSRRHCDRSDCDGVGVVRMQGEQSEVGPGGNMAIGVPSIHLSHIHQVVLDQSIPLRHHRWTPGQGDAIRTLSKPR